MKKEGLDYEAYLKNKQKRTCPVIYESLQIHKI